MIVALFRPPAMLDEAVDGTSPFEEVIAPVDVIFDTAGGDRLRRSATVLRPGGRLVSVAETPPEGGVFFVVEPNREQLEAIAGQADAGTLRAPAVETFPLTEASEAFARSLQPGRRGKVVLVP